jgi:hypothetical protein
MILKLNEGVDLELKPLKALRQKIKDFRQKQYDDIYNQYKKKAGTDDQQEEETGAPVVETKSSKTTEKPSYYFKGIKKFDKALTSK